MNNIVQNYNYYLDKEIERQSHTISLIASENYVSGDVLRALGSVFTNKYSEGYPAKRYYAGNIVVDEMENWVRKLAINLFDLDSDIWMVNVQPYSGSPANLAIYLGLLNIGDKILSMKLDHGGHLTHGHKVSASGRLFDFCHYGLDAEGKIDLVELEKKLVEEKPKLVVLGSSSYPGIIDFEKIGSLVKKYETLILADVSHISGLMAAKVHPSCFGVADVVMTTTHKTLRGPRSALIYAKKELMEQIDRSVFPGLQGGPHLNNILGVGVALSEASRSEFIQYQKQVLANAQVLAEELKSRNINLVMGGTENHIVLIDVSKSGIDSISVEKGLEKIGIVVNKNVIPNDKNKPFNPSGIRLGTPAVTTRGMKEQEIKKIATIVADVIERKVNDEQISQYQNEVGELTKRFPVPSLKCN